MRRFDRNFLRGQGLVEYVLLLLLLGSAIILALSISGVSLSELYADAVDGLGLSGTDAACAVLGQAGEDWQAFKDGFWKGGIAQVDGRYAVCPLCGGLLPGNPGSDYSIDMSGVTIQNIQPTWNGYGVSFRSNYDKGGLDGYMFEVEQVNKNKPAQIYFSKWVNGKQIQPPLSIATAPANFDWENPPDFQVEVQGDTFTAYLDGKQMLTAKDSTYKEGGVGAISNHGTQLTFDNLVVEALDCAEEIQ